ncbi:MAG: hypothetical protein J6C31_06475 [Prevotella sp.]|nr:hypothetical protein [Prevotella sp.]
MSERCGLTAGGWEQFIGFLRDIGKRMAIFATVARGAPYARASICHKRDARQLAETSS